VLFSRATPTLRRAACAGAVVAALSLAGCTSAAEPAASTATPSTSAAAPDAATTPAADAAAAAPAPVTPTPRQPGEGVADGLGLAPSAAPVPTLPAQPFTKPTVTTGAFTATVTGWRTITTPAGAPGEIAGPGVALDIAVTNTGSAPLDLSNVVADLRTGADEAPLLRADREPTVPFSGTLAPGQSARATYAFNAAADQRSNVTLYLSLNAGAPTVVLRGDVR
jgi:hypothetical protein